MCVLCAYSLSSARLQIITFSLRACAIVFNIAGGCHNGALHKLFDIVASSASSSSLSWNVCNILIFNDFANNKRIFQRFSFYQSASDSELLRDSTYSGVEPKWHTINEMSWRSQNTKFKIGNCVPARVYEWKCICLCGVWGLRGVSGKMSHLTMYYRKQRKTGHTTLCGRKINDTVYFARKRRGRYRLHSIYANAYIALYSGGVWVFKIKWVLSHEWMFLYRGNSACL